MSYFGILFLFLAFVLRIQVLRRSSVSYLFIYSFISTTLKGKKNGYKSGEGTWKKKLRQKWQDSQKVIITLKHKK